MFHKLIFGFVAAASLLTIALAPTGASARPFGFGGGPRFHEHHFHPGFAYIGGGYGYDGCYVVRPVLTPFGYRRRIVNVCAY